MDVDRCCQSVVFGDLGGQQGADLHSHKGPLQRTICTSNVLHTNYITEHIPHGHFDEITLCNLDRESEWLILRFKFLGTRPEGILAS